MTNIGNIPGVNPALTNLGQEPAATPAAGTTANVPVDGFDLSGQGIERVLVDLGIAATDPNFSLDRYPASARAELSSISSALSSGDTDQVQSQFANFNFFKTLKGSLVSDLALLENGLPMQLLV